MRNKILGLCDWKARIADIFSLAIIQKVTSEEVNAVIKERVWKELSSLTPKGRKRYSGYMQGYVQGLIDRHRDELWKLMDFRYLYKGVLYSTDRNAKNNTSYLHSLNLPWEEWDRMKRCHYWTGTDKPYYLGENSGP